MRIRKSRRWFGLGKVGSFLLDWEGMNAGQECLKYIVFRLPMQPDESGEMVLYFCSSLQIFPVRSMAILLIYYTV